MLKLPLVPLLAAVLLTASVSSAQPRTYDEKRAAYRDGFAAVRDKRWTDAYEIFLRLWSEEQTFDVAVNLGQAELQLGKYRDAAEHLAFGASRIPLGESKELVERIKQALERARAEVGSVTVVSDRTGAAVRVDGKPAGITPIDTELFVEPGAHTIDASLAGYAPARQEFEASAGKRQSVVFKLEPATTASGAVPANDSTPPSATRPNAGTPVEQKTPGPDYSGAIIAASVGGAALVGGIVSLVVAANEHADAEARLRSLSGQNPCGAGIDAARGRECSELSDRAHGAQTFQALGYVGLGAALAAGAVTYVLWPSSRSGASGARARTSVTVSGSGVFAALHGAF